MEGDTWNDDAALLEAHLDGALSPEQAEFLGRRLAMESALAAELEVLRAQRVVRQAVWASYEPEQARAASAAAASLALAERAERLRRTARYARRATAAAAVVLLAFASGWVARGVRSVQPTPLESREARSGGSHPFASSGASVSAGDASASFPVALTDERGNIIAVQHFDNPRKAREFADDVDRWQSRPRRTPPAAAPATPPGAPPAVPLTPVSDEF